MSAAIEDLRKADQDLARKEEEYQREELTYYVISETRKLFGQGPLKRVVNVGGGYGSHCKILAGIYPKSDLISIDLFKPPITGHGGVSYAVASADQISSIVEPESTDLVLMIEVIEHVHDSDAAIRAVWGTLRRGGFLILTTPNLSSLLNRLALLIGLMPMEAEVSNERIFGRPGTHPVGHLRLFTFRSLIEFLAYHEFKVTRAYTVCASRVLFAGANRRYRFAYAVDRFGRMISSKLASRSLVVAEKL